MRGMLVAVLAAALAVGCGEEASPDKRTAVQLTVEQKNAVLIEMRTMLASVNGVLSAAARSDSAGIRSAALASGSAAAADPTLEKLLPEQWMQLAMQTHGGFDSLAAGAGPGARGRDAAVARLGAITTNCVTCHSIYRLVAR